MDFRSIHPDDSIGLFVKNILIFDEHERNQKTVLPFFADGYPGLIFYETENGLWVRPHNKMMPPLFLYGQTIRPIALVMTNAYKLIVFQFYPFVLNSFFNLTPQALNDQCYDLEQLGPTAIHTREKLLQADTEKEKLNIISDFLLALFQRKKQALDEKIVLAIKQIIRQKGQLEIRAVYEKLHLTERTFQRRFLQTVGITAKQFAKVIQFQHAYEQISAKAYQKLSDIAYANGFADQSHFIRVFKAFTGKTPLTLAKAHP